MTWHPEGSELAWHGEGPVWDIRSGRLFWVDMFAGDVLHTVPGSGTTERWKVGEIVTAIRPRLRGGWVKTAT